MGLLVFVAIALLAIFASWIAPQNPYDLAQLDIMDGRLPPGSKSMVGYTYILGTDDQGRDMFSGMLYGLRISLAVGVGSALFAAVVGTSLGLLSAWLGGRADSAIMRLVDLQLSFPSILVALMILAVLGKGVMNVVLALVIVEWAYYARTVRATAMVERQREYIEAAECLALPKWRIMFRHLLPNCLPPLIVIATQQVARAIALEATLSFLGLGVPITEPSLGLLIANGYQYMLSGKYWISFYPGIALLVTIMSINLVGDQLRDVLNPRLTAMNATIEVRDLRTHFFTRAGVVKAVDDVSFSVSSGQVLGLVGESGSGKTVTGFSIIGLVDPPGRIAGGSIWYQGRDLAKLSENEMRVAARQPDRDDLSGPDDDAQSGAADRYADDRDGPGARQGFAGGSAAAVARRARHGRHPKPRGTPAGLSAPVLRRHAATRRDRHRVAAQSRFADRRRTDDRARRHHPGANSRRGAEARDRARHRADLDHA